MGQFSVRLDPELHERARHAAADAGTSLNAYIALVLRAAVEPSNEEPELDRIRARLAAAGLIDSASPPPPSSRSAEDEAAFAAAVARSAGGTPGSALITEERASGW